MKTLLLSLISISILAAIGCVTKIDPYQEDISSVELLQKAYEATDVKNHTLAISYYEAYLERFPDDIKGCLWAKYEIAFLYHKKGNDKKAIELFTVLLEDYENDPRAELPQAPKVLAEKVMKNILDEKEKEEAAETE